MLCMLVAPVRHWACPVPQLVESIWSPLCADNRANPYEKDSQARAERYAPWCFHLSEVHNIIIMFLYSECIWRPPVKKSRRAHFKFRDKASRHFMREENFRASISTQVGQYGRYYCAQLICAKQFRACVGAIFFRENINASYCPSLPEPFIY